MDRTFARTTQICGLGKTAWACALALAAATLTMSAFWADRASASRTQWSIFEDPSRVTSSAPLTKSRTLTEIKSLGADTIRVQVRWASVAPSPHSKRKPRFNSADPAAYPGFLFAPFDQALAMAHDMGFRLLVTITGDPPLWAKIGHRNVRGWAPIPREYANFAAAVAKRYAGNFGGLPRVDDFALWNEPNWYGLLAPQAACKRRSCTVAAANNYRNMVRAAYPAIKKVNRRAMVIIGELSPSGSDIKAPLRPTRPLAFLRALACRDSRLHKIKSGACRHFRPAIGDAFGMHPYSLYARFLSPKSGSRARDDVSIGDTHRLFRVLDKLTRRGGLKVGGGKRRFDVYFTEFGNQTNPPDPFQGANPVRAAQFINESEEYSYRLSRVKSYSQYQLYDERPKPGPAHVRWSSYQMGLRFANGRKKPSYEAYKFPIVVKKRGGGVLIWGRVRPATGTRYVQLQRKSGARFVDVGGTVKTNGNGYFTVRRPRGIYRFRAFNQSSASAAGLLGASRTAKASPR
jgi:Cellulase (glycosyl hydrolase family 5)